MDDDDIGCFAFVIEPKSENFPATNADCDVAIFKTSDAGIPTFT